MGKIIVCTVCNGSGTIINKEGKRVDCFGCGGSGTRDVG